jgi:DNA-binding CsgD family transcriptional regulator
MYLTARQSNALTRVMAVLAEPHEEREIRMQVGMWMLDLLDAQHYASFVWDASSAVFDNGVHINMDPVNLSAYQSYYQHHDPITPTLQQYRVATHVNKVMPQDALTNTEFFNDFLTRDGLFWGVNLFAWNGEHNIGDMRIWRDRRHQNFNNDDLAILDLVRPAFVAALARCHTTTEATSPSHDIRISRSLSCREHEIALLVGAGQSDKEIARALSISVATVRTHIDHAFRKLDVKNRAALACKLPR